MKARKYPNKDYFNKIFRYGAETGILYNKITRSNALKDAPVGCLNRNIGYLVVRVAYRLYYIHRIIWIMLNGNIARDMQIDHIDHNRTNNKIENLRLVTNTENAKNRTTQNNNTSGHTGVSWRKDRRKWEARIKMGGKYIHLGLFENIEDAIKARKQAEINHGFHKNHGKDGKCSPRRRHLSR